MEQEQLRNHLDHIGQNLHEICKEIAEVLILVHVHAAPAINTPLPVVHDTPVPATDEKGRISSRQLAMLRKLCNERLDGNWNSFDASCKARFGKAVNYLTMKDASTLISELLGEGGSHGHQSRTSR